MSASRENSDLSAVRYRRTQGDLRLFMAAFAARIERVIPGRVTLERTRSQFFSTTHDLLKVIIDTEPNVYIVTYDEERLSVTRTKSVRGNTLKSEALTLPEWLSALAKDIRRLSDKPAAADEILEDFANALTHKHRSKSALERYSASSLVTIWSMSGEHRRRN